MPELRKEFTSIRAEAGVLKQTLEKERYSFS